MESEYFENDRNNETGTFSKKEAVCDQPPTNTVSGRSIIFLKDMDRIIGEMRTFMRLSCLVYKTSLQI